MITDRDIRKTELYGEVCEYFRTLSAVGQDAVVDAADLTASADERRHYGVVEPEGLDKSKSCGGGAVFELSCGATPFAGGVPHA